MEKNILDNGVTMSGYCGMCAYYYNIRGIDSNCDIHPEFGKMKMLDICGDYEEGKL